MVDGDKRQKLRIHSVTLIGGRPVVKIKGVRTREEAARLTNFSVEIPGEKARVLPEGSFYQFELIGCRVIGADRTEYGVIEEVLFYPANDVYRIRSERFGETLFPAVDRFVVRVDVPGREIVIDPPAGLFRAEQAMRPADDNASD
jgi:16S rRNA processing protein RimM